MIVMTYTIYLDLLSNARLPSDTKYGMASPAEMINAWKNDLIRPAIKKVIQLVLESWRSTGNNCCFWNTRLSRSLVETFEIMKGISS